MVDLEVRRLERLVEGLIAPWDGRDRPGVTVGVVRGESLLVHRSAGMASIELGVPIGPETCFRIASVSKQFTCAAILLLAADGRLSLEDEATRYIPELAGLGERVTLDQLMHNSAGVRDMLELMRLGGTDLAQPVGPDDLMAAICRQRRTNFTPGTRYLYSNSNFLLLGRVVERVSGQSLRNFLAEHILAPAGMGMTRMVERTTEPVPGLATGYLPAAGGGWERAQHGFPLHGEGALVSSVIDLALWHRNYATGRVGGTALAASLAEPGRFANGMENGYARGLRLAEVRGLATVSHGGLWPGYKTEFLRIPARDEAVIVIANAATADPYLIGQRILEARLEGARGVQPAVKLPPAAEQARYVGRFLDEAAPASVDFSRNEAGQLIGSTNGVSFPVKALADGRLAARRSAPDWSMALSPDGETLAVELDAGVAASYRRIAPGAALPEDLPGAYRCEELAATWRIGAEEGGMRLRVAGSLANTGPWELEGLAGDMFRVYTPGTLYRAWQDVRLLRDAAGRPSGLLLNGGRVKHMAFIREHDA
jgi:D-aminopeptidase